MKMTNLTLNLIKSRSPCKDGYERLLESFGKTEADDTPVSIRHLLEFNGVSDTLWVIFRCIKGREMDKRNMIADIAEGVLHIFEKKYPDDKRPRRAIEVIKNKKATKEEIKEAFENAYATWAGEDTYNAAACAVWAAARTIAYNTTSWRVNAWDVAEYAIEAAMSAIWNASAARDTEIERQRQIILKWFGND